MTHFSTLSRIVIDVPGDEHDRVVAFWRAALNLPLVAFERFPDYHGAALPHEGMGLLVQRLGGGAPRVHLDIHTTDRSAEVARLSELGATVVEEAEMWTVMHDPAGLIFCVVTDAGLDDTNSNRWTDEPA